MRTEEEETAKGPYNLDKLRTLAEAGIVTREHVYFDVKMEAWLPIQSNESLMEQIFPAKKKLSLRAKAAIAAADSNQDEEDAHGEKAIRIEDMLAAAEGNTKETRYIREQAQWRDRTAAISVPAIGIILLASAATMIYPSWEVIANFLNDAEASYLIFLQYPVLLLGVLDLVLGIMVLLNALEIFPFIRLRALLGSGFFSTLYFVQYYHGDPSGLWLGLAALGFGIGLFVCTLTLSFRLMLTAVIASAVGVVGLAWWNTIVPLIDSFKG